ncbi:hypothetical protein Gpo141_00008646 [Globisporangium polare]
MQELAKWSALKTKARDIRVMCVAVGIPTVLIDTQTRLVVQRIRTAQGTNTGTLFMTLIEIMLRVSKLALVKWEVRHRQNAQEHASPSVTSVTAASREVTTDAANFARWECDLSKLYMAEVYADLAAEYIAIGCSMSILFFYRNSELSC